MQDKSRKCHIGEQEILSRWTEYCSEIYKHKCYGGNTYLGCNQHPEEDLKPILRETVEIAEAALKERGSMHELMIYQQNLSKQVGKP